MVFFVRFFLGLLLVGGFAGQVSAQSAGAQSLLILDYSNSMWEPFGEGARMQETRRILRSQLSRNASVFDGLGLMAYGHRSADSCSDIELIHAPGTASLPEILATAEGLTPTGQTPLSQAVLAGADALNGQGTIILLSDGTESCGQDPCAVAQSLAGTQPDVRVHLITIGMSAADAQTLSCLPNATGGRLLSAANADELADAFAETRQVIIDAVEEDILVTEVGDLTEQSVQQDFEITALEAENAALRAQLAGLQALNDAQDADGQTAEPQETQDPEIHDEMRTQVAELEGFVARLEAENERLASQSQQAQANNADLRAQIEALSTELDRSRDLAGQMQAALVDAQGESAELGEAYDSLLTELQNLNLQASAPANCSVLEGQLGTTQGLLDQQTAINGQLEARLAELSSAPDQSALTLCSAEIEHSLDLADSLNAEMEGLLADRVTLIADNRRLTAEFEEEQQNRINGVAAFGLIEAQLFEAEAQIAALQDELAVMEGSAAMAATRMEQAQSTITIQSEEIEALSLEVEAATQARQDEFDAANVRLAEAREALSSAQGVAETYTGDLAALEEINNSLQLTINQIQVDNADKDGDLASMAQEVANLRGQLNESRRLNEGYLQRLDQMELYIATLISAQEQMALPTTSAQEEVETTTTTTTVVVEDHTAQLTELREALLAEQDALQSLEQDLAAALDELAAQQLELDQLQSQLDDQASQMVEERAVCAALQVSHGESQVLASFLQLQIEEAEAAGSACARELRITREAIPARDGADTVRVELLGAGFSDTAQSFVWEIEGLDTSSLSNGTGRQVSLPQAPGRYAVRLLFGDASVEETYEVLPNITRHHVMTLGAGIVSVRFDDGIPTALQNERVEVTLTSAAAARPPVRQAFLAGRGLEMPIAPGQYTLTAQSQTQTYSQDIWIAPSAREEVILPWTTSLANIRFVQSPGGSSVTAPVQWRIFQGDELVVTGSGDREIPLSLGDYALTANVGGIITREAFTLTRATSQDVIVPFEKGQIDLTFRNDGADIQDLERFYWELFDISQSGGEATLAATGSAEDREIVVPAGTYRLDGYYGNVQRSTTIDLMPAQAAPALLSFSSGQIRLMTEAREAQEVEWRLEHVAGGAAQVFKTTGGELLYALRPGRYLVSVQVGSEARSGSITVREGETLELQLN